VRDGCGGNETSPEASALGSLNDVTNRKTIGCDTDPAIVRLVACAHSCASRSRVGDEAVGRVSADKTNDLHDLGELEDNTVAYIAYVPSHRQLARQSEGWCRCSPSR
jgi:hypothetical protein